MSSNKPDLMPEGAPFVIGEAIMQALLSDAALAGATLLSNPARAADVLDGARVVFFEDQHDKLIAQPGQRAKRTYTFSVGVVNRSEDARRASHADYRAAKRVLRERVMRFASDRQIELVEGGLRELEARFRLENIDVGGGLVLGTFAIDYRDPN